MFLQLEGHWIWNVIPNYTFPWGGRKGYDNQWILYGDDDFWGPGWRIAWWREVCHMIGGIVLTLPLLYFSLNSKEPLKILMIGPLVLILGITALELFSIWINPTQRFWRVKNTIDVLSWTCGGIATLAIGLWMHSNPDL